MYVHIHIDYTLPGVGHLAVGHISIHTCVCRVCELSLATTVFPFTQTGRQSLFVCHDFDQIRENDTADAKCNRVSVAGF